MLLNQALNAVLDNEEENIQVLHLVTPSEMLRAGLKLLGFTKKQYRNGRKRNHSVNHDRFKSALGATPLVLCTIYEDLQKSTIVDDGFEVKLTGNDIKLKFFLVSFHFLRKYPTKSDRQFIFNCSDHHTRDQVWDILRRIQCLKATKITWPDDLGGDDIWIMTVDGTHCAVEEPNHPIWSQDREYYSHKYNRAGINYELGISIGENKLIWMNGLFKAGKNDVSIFTKHGLKNRLLNLKKKAIGDGGYHGHYNCISTPNAHDSKAVRTFKSRALKRHETFNGRTKVFEILRQRFRNDVKTRFPIVFESICVICQYKIEYETPLFDVLVEDLIYMD
mgnify:CR=1 FL=1